MSGKRQENCTNFLKGHCKYEDRCMYMHPSKGWCYFETRLYEGCKKSAAECEFRHPRSDKERDMAFEFFEEQLFHRKGACVEALSDENGFTGWHYCDKDGSDCKYAHPFSEEQLDRWIATNQSKRREWCRPKVTIGHCDYGDKACSFKHPSSPTEWIEAQEHFAEKRYKAMGACYRDLRGEHCDDHDTLQCQYAHSATPEQLRRWRSDPDRPGKRKPCLNFLRDGTCDYGKRCWFKHYHTADELEKARADDSSAAGDAASTNAATDKSVDAVASVGDGKAEADDDNTVDRIRLCPRDKTNRKKPVQSTWNYLKRAGISDDRLKESWNLTGALRGEDERVEHDLEERLKREISRGEVKVPIDFNPGEFIIYPSASITSPPMWYTHTGATQESIVHVPVSFEGAQNCEDLGVPKEDEVKTEYRATVEAMQRD